MSLYALKPQFQKMLAPAAAFCVSHAISPDCLNAAGTLCALFAGGALCMAAGNVPLAYGAVPVFLLLRTAFNALDGMVARGLGTSSFKGRYQNELCDRISDAAFFLMMIFSGHGTVELGAVALAVTLLVSFTGLLPQAAGGRRICAGIMGKPDRMAVFGAASVAAMFAVPHIWDIALVVVVIGGLVTMIIRIVTSYKELTHVSY